MSAIRCPMWIFCCSIRWISSPCWLSKWMGLAFMRPGASRQGGIKNSILEKCAVPFLRLRTDGSGEKGKIQTALKEDRLCRKLSGTRSDARNVETLLKARLSMISSFAAAVRAPWTVALIIFVGAETLEIGKNCPKWKRWKTTAH